MGGIAVVWRWLRRDVRIAGARNGRKEVVRGRRNVVWDRRWREGGGSGVLCLGLLRWPLEATMCFTLMMSGSHVINAIGPLHVERTLYYNRARINDIFLHVEQFV
jgi:hypothetical protein